MLDLSLLSFEPILFTRIAWKLFFGRFRNELAIMLLTAFRFCFIINSSCCYGVIPNPLSYGTTVTGYILAAFSPRLKMAAPMSNVNFSLALICSLIFLNSMPLLLSHSFVSLFYNFSKEANF
jgi:hypothetical protein